MLSSASSQGDGGAAQHAVHPEGLLCAWPRSTGGRECYICRFQLSLHVPEPQGLSLVPRILGPSWSGHLLCTLLVWHLVGGGGTVDIKGNQSHTISIKFLNEVTVREAARDQSGLILTFIKGHNPSETVDS